jgi:hypothetical protein
VEAGPSEGRVEAGQPSREGGGRYAAAARHGSREGTEQGGRHGSREALSRAQGGMTLDLAAGSDCSGARLLWVGRWVEKNNSSTFFFSQSQGVS